jgi:hypothetical protein
MTLLAHFRFHLFLDEDCIYEIYKTLNNNEYAVCSGQGLFFIDVVKQNNKYTVTENTSEYYNICRNIG